MTIIQQIQQHTAACLQHQFEVSIPANEIAINLTNTDFTGDYTIVVFNLSKKLGKSPVELANTLGTELVNTHPNHYTQYEVVKGFLNLSLNTTTWVNILDTNYTNTDYGKQVSNGKKVMVEYSSPNTNKPLHLGHLRNNFLGWSVAEIFKACGYSIVKTCIVNDRGVHICKSMLAWQKFAKGATPESTKTKGDHFVGEYYVQFNDALKLEIAELVEKGMAKEEAEKKAPSLLETQQMLLDWENGKQEVIELWKKMNSWVYQGFDITYKSIGSNFDKIYYESDTYLLGKEMVQQGLAKNLFYKKEDGSVWIDLTAEGQDNKLVLRKDGTSVYITQDLGLIQFKYDEYHSDESIYVIGDEQNYHMEVLKLIAEKLKLPNAAGIHHLSYGMVELPSGKMKSREGTVVDADDLVAQMINNAKTTTEALGKVDDFTATELEQLYHQIALGAMKFFLLKVSAKKRMVFNPEESIDFHGFTGPFVQYTFARIQSILRKQQPSNTATPAAELVKEETDLIKQLELFGSVIQQAKQELDPSPIANYIYQVAKQFNLFYTKCSVLKAETESLKNNRLKLCLFTSNVLQTGLGLLGIAAPNRM
jgi:arginyl-tRNA synthetase